VDEVVAHPPFPTPGERLWEDLLEYTEPLENWKATASSVLQVTSLGADKGADKDRKWLMFLQHNLASECEKMKSEPDVQAPVSFWDLAGFTKKCEAEVLKRRRHAERRHGRVAMWAAMGYITPENTGKFPGYPSPLQGEVGRAAGVHGQLGWLGRGFGFVSLCALLGSGPVVCHAILRGPTSHHSLPTSVSPPRQDHGPTWLQAHGQIGCKMLAAMGNLCMAASSCFVGEAKTNASRGGGAMVAISNMADARICVFPLAVPIVGRPAGPAGGEGPPNTFGRV